MDFNNLEYSDYWLNLYGYNDNILADTSFHLRVFYVKLTLNLELNSSAVDGFNSVNNDWIQLLSYNKGSLLFFPLIKTEPVTSRWFQSEGLANETSYPLSEVYLTIQSEFFDL